MKKLIMIAVAAMLALNVAAEDKKDAPKKGGRQGFMKELGPVSYTHLTLPTKA